MQDSRYRSVEAVVSRGGIGVVSEMTGRVLVKRTGAYRSASFCVSITAATGMPKLETGPQKSIGRNIVVSLSSLLILSRPSIVSTSRLLPTKSTMFIALLTCRADIAKPWMGPDLGVRGGYERRHSFDEIDQYGLAACMWSKSSF